LYLPLLILRGASTFAFGLMTMILNQHEARWQTWVGNLTSKVVNETSLECLKGDLVLTMGFISSIKTLILFLVKKNVITLIFDL
jgi:Na+-transporting NADH:ubiquinone oxidoreductase subunit NqrB